MNSIEKKFKHEILTLSHKFFTFCISLIFIISDLLIFNYHTNHLFVQNRFSELFDN